MRSLLRRWREWRAAREEYRDSMAEMQFHVEQETEHNIRNGMTPEDARRAAMKSFGGVDRFAEAAHDERPGTKWSDFRVSWLDWKLGTRMLRKYPVISIISILTLAVAIGLGAAWFEMSTMMFRPSLPLDDGDRIVRIEYWSSETMSPEGRIMHEFPQWRDQLTTIEQVGAHRTVERNMLLPGAEPVIVDIAEISPVAFEVTRVPPLLGRPLVAADEVAGSEDVVVIGYDAWQTYFDGDRTVVGREVRLGSTRARIVGVMPEGYKFPLYHQFWIPLRPVQAGPLEAAPIRVFGRLRPGVSLETAEAEVAAWGARMAQQSPETHERLRLRAMPFAAPSQHDAMQELLLINLGAWLILAGAAANVAALMFARTALRESEIVVRNALGASRGRVMGQLFTEALVLTSVAAVLGLVAVRVAMQFMKWDGSAPFWWESNLSPATMLYTALLAIAGAGMVGLLPALRATGRHVRAGLSQMGSGGTSMRFGGAWSVIIVLQVAFSVLCLPFGIAATIEAVQESRVRAQFPADPYLTFFPSLQPEELNPEVAELPETNFIEALVTRLRQEPEVAAVATTSSLPGTYHPLRQVEVQHGAEAPRLVDAFTEGDRVRVGAVSPGFFSVFNLPVIAGREFTAGDVDAASRVVVINESLARNIGGNPIGAHVRFAAEGEEEPGEWMQVVGVVANFGLTPTTGGEADHLYEVVSRDNPGYVVARINGDLAAFGPRVRTLAMDVNPLLRIYDVASLREVIRRANEDEIIIMFVALGVVMLAIMLSAASLYALMSVSVALRTREIGIRIAIGAGARSVLSALFRRAATQVALGLVIGNALVLVALGMMTEELQPAYIVPPMLAASIAMLLVGAAACLVPARRALRVQPTEALRQAR